MNNLRKVGHGGWSPKLLGASLVLWLDAGDPSTLFQDTGFTVPTVNDGDPVGGWKDKSGAGNHATQATAGQRPLLKFVSGRRRIRFDNVDDNMSTALSLTGGSALVAVGNANSSANNRILNSTTVNAMVAFDRSSAIYAFAGTIISSSTPLDLNKHVAVVTKAAAGNWAAYLDGTNVTTANTATDWGTVVMGFVGTFAEASNSDVAAILGINRVLTAAEIASISNWGKGL
jgi:hypothetical protein